MSYAPLLTLIDTERLPKIAGMSWFASRDHGVATIRDVEGHPLQIRDLNLIWWRRVSRELQYPETVVDGSARDLIERDCTATMIGSIVTEFEGAWVSHPEASRVAENKLIQLRAAHAAGLKVPSTIVSQDPELIRSFCSQLDYQVVVKTVAGTHTTPLLTGKIEKHMLASDEPLSLSPAIYQELVPGTRHLRACYFGGEIHTALIVSERLDWRYPLDARLAPYELDRATMSAVTNAMQRLSLRMGVIDMKLDRNGEPIWLEVNPQGQFLFIEQLCGLPLLLPFTDFLVREGNSKN